MPSLGVIGQGSFGTFMADKLADYFEIQTYRLSDPDSQLQVVCNCDYVALAVPFDAYPETLKKIADLTPKSSVIVDVCSVKTLPIAAIKEILPEHKLLATHPLFGPQSAAKTLKNHTIIVVEVPGSEIVTAKGEKFFEKLGLVVKIMTAEEHDKLMAQVHALTFFVARGLTLYGVDEQTVMTPSYQELLDLANLEKHHSPELFATIQLANPYASEARDRLMLIFEELQLSLKAK
jgi:prephenate dehydrogenase